MDKSIQITVFYILTHMGLIFFLYPANIIESTTTAHWIPICIGLFVHILIVIIYLKGLQFFPHKDLVSIYTASGVTMTFLFLLPVGVYFLMINIITVRAYSEIIMIIFLSKTPLWAIMGLLLFSATYLAYKGLKAIFQTGLILAILVLPLILFTIVVSFQNVDWRYIYPIWNDDFSFFNKSVYYKSFFAIGGSFLFLGFVHPVLPYRPKMVLLSVIAILPLFLISVYVPIMTFGQATSSNFLFPYVMTVDAINLSWLMLNRVTLFFLLGLVIFITLFMALVLWKTARIMHAFLPLRNQGLLVILLAIFIFSCALFISDWKEIEKIFGWNTPLRFYVVFGVPISVLILGLRRTKGETTP
ncbi:GerAB/ArcD/ProY family transporter [Oceanobacillus sp. M65]|uniref:GerAB/ArcD/ProY family transporter n=1 Tax=Oceanobacillus sp. M65 TaxID=3457435 RepID=UPI003FCD443F